VLRFARPITAATEFVTKPDLHNVSRHDHKRYHAWVVQIRRRGRITIRYFSDRKHGGRTKALQAAIAFRDSTLQKLPPLLWTMQRYVFNTTGIIGVRLQVDRKPQGVYRAYVATWPVDGSGRRRSRTFSFGKFGKERAFELAVKARRQGLALLRRTTPRETPRTKPSRFRRRP